MKNEKTRIDIGELIKKYGSDLSSVDLSEYTIYTKERNLFDVIFPMDRDFFKNLDFNSLYGIIMPEVDYDIYDFEGISIQGVKFSKGSILPRDRDFFQKIKFKDLRGAIMPEADYNIYNFKGVDIRAVKFTENSILPRNKDFFVELYRGDLSFASMPKGDYRYYNFSGVDCYETVFTFDSMLPEDKSFLQTLYNSGCRFIIKAKTFKFTQNILENIHNYDLDGVSIDLRGYEDFLTDTQISLIRTRYKDEIGGDILLPTRGLLDESIKDRRINSDNILTI